MQLLARERDDPVLRVRGPVPVSVASEQYLRLCWRNGRNYFANSGIVIENVELPRDEDGELRAPSEIYIGSTVKLDVIADKVGDNIDPGFHALGVWGSSLVEGAVIRVGDPVVLVFGGNA